MKRIRFISKSSITGRDVCTSLELPENSTVKDAIKILLNDINHWNGIALSGLQQIIIEKGEA